MKKVIKLTESDLTRIVRRVINESSDEDRRYERIIDKLVMSYYSDVKYRKQGSSIFVFKGKTFSKHHRVRNDEYKKSNIIMVYETMGDRLTIFVSNFKSLESIIPGINLNDIKMIKYFIKSMTKLFTDKFGFTPKNVGMDDKIIMDKIRSTPDI